MTTAPTASQAAAAQDHGCLPRGYRLREFVIERVLGDGGFGVVYSALDLRLERRVAIKEYMPSALARRDTDYSVQMLTSQRQRDAFEVGLRSFINEARLLARFEHPSLIKVHQFWQEKGTAYMVMPYYAAPTLRAWVRDQRAPVSEAWLRTFLLRAMDAVEVLHAQSCLHRDIAPDNILVLKDGQPLLLDFGAARRVIGGLHRALTVIVKPGFAPLEQYTDTATMKQGPWTDVYALAAVAHYVITGQAPAPAVSRVLADEMVPLRERARDRYSASLLGALDTALAVKPERRPQSIAAFRALLQSAQAGEWETTRLVVRTVQPARTAVAQAAEIDDQATVLMPRKAPRAVAPAPVQPVAAAASTPKGERGPVGARTVQRTAGGTVPPTVPRTVPRTGAAAAERTAARITDFDTLTQAVRKSIAPETQHSRWVSALGYVLALLTFGGALALTAHLVVRYVDAGAQEGRSTTMVTRSAVPQTEAMRAPASTHSGPMVAAAGSVGVR